jgi:hypothetical protein
MKLSRAYQAERVQKLLEAEPRLRAVLGPCDVVMETRVGRPVKVSAGTMAVVQALNDAGESASEYRRAIVFAQRSGCSCTPTSRVSRA